MLKLQAHIWAQFWDPDVQKSSGILVELFSSVVNQVERANEMKMHRNTWTHLISVYGSFLWANTYQTSIYTL
jgi:hypothetical protein